jgi:hypothetical protein
MMSSLVSSYVDAINHGGVPDIKKGWGYVVEESLKRACEIACRCGGRCVLFGGAVLAEIHLCNACSCHEILRRSGRGQLVPRAPEGAGGPRV